ncbi:uncharacterized protein LOC114654948 [Erpetoichthys calabaricus]|uniref:uncharacterized protein LOC114654948 n=1 Tax=Erpetoichthys calabaricus TaxID=27687 RepID=UPI0010A08708|nr:uncharacterized protein LOC114654948 [Erpetoichthys calabaricus]XP_051779205.1 uncharacterized protein LOC114654948 [Erpetoichthys calabaricus]
MMLFVLLVVLVEFSSQFKDDPLSSIEGEQICAHLSFPYLKKKLSLPSSGQKIQMELEWSGEFISAIVMEGCLLTLWKSVDTQFYSSGEYPNISTGPENSVSAVRCSCESGDSEFHSRFNDFKRKHMASESAQGSDYFCINEIRNRNITIRGRCKEKNTFIFADIARVIKVCTNGESLKKRDLFKSKERFRITDCSYTGNPQPVCQYKAINYNQRYIVLGCDNNKKPIHFEESL